MLQRGRRFLIAGGHWRCSESCGLLWSVREIRVRICRGPYRLQSSVPSIRYSPCCRMGHSCARGLCVGSDGGSVRRRMALTGSLGDEAALYHCSAIRGLAKGNFVDDEVLLDDSTAYNAEAIPCSRVVFDNRPSALVADRLSMMSIGQPQQINLSYHDHFSLLGYPSERVVVSVPFQGPDFLLNPLRGARDRFLLFSLVYFSFLVPFCCRKMYGPCRVECWMIGRSGAAVVQPWSLFGFVVVGRRRASSFRTRRKTKLLPV